MAFLNVWTVTYVELRAITRVPSYLAAGVVGTYIQIDAFVSSGRGEMNHKVNDTIIEEG